MTDVWDRLKEPFNPVLISWRIGSTNKKSVQYQTKDNNAKATKGIALAYINARDVMSRLDEVVGQENWSDKYFETQSGRLICELSIKVGGVVVTKSDGAGDTDVEGEKGAISDAFKRAAVKFGIGRYLYDLPNSWVELDDKEKMKAFPKLPDWALPGGVPMIKIERVHREIFKHYAAIAAILKCDDSLGLTQLTDELVEAHGEQGKQLVWSMLDTNEKELMRKLLDEQRNMNKGEAA